MTIVFSFALRGAGDTLFVTLVSLCLAWPLMVLPTWLAWQWHWGIFAGWGFRAGVYPYSGTLFSATFSRGQVATDARH